MIEVLSVACEFIEELNKLRKSSIEAVDDANNETDSFKRYLHVERTVERELKELLNTVNLNGKKTLVLVCGSAGDGKSHLLSKLKNEKGFLESYDIRNDGTESFKPEMTSTEALDEILDSFSDANLEQYGKNLILAINLGTLSKFVDSVSGQKYIRLIEFIDKMGILTGNLTVDSYDSDSHFQYVSFSDFNIFTLTENGVKSEFIEKIIARVATDDDKNPFHKKYCSMNNCPLSEKCPVRHNYEFLMIPQVQKNLASAIVETIIKDKLVVSTREILDFIFNVLVHHDFSHDNMLKSKNDNEYFMYIDYLLPSLLYEYSDISPLINNIIKYDILRERHEMLDESAVDFSVSQKVDSIICDTIDNTPYKGVVITDKLNDYVSGNKRKDNKLKLFKLMMRLKKILDDESIPKDKIYQEFVRYLYYFNCNKKGKLESLYELVQNGIFQWAGGYEDKYLRINRNIAIAVFEELSIKSCHALQPENQGDELQKFVPYIKVYFRTTTDESVVCLDIDYPLFKMLHDIKSGYKPTADDNNTYAEFVSFISKISLLGNFEEEVMLIQNGKRGKFKKTDFGYKFEVI